VEPAPEPSKRVDPAGQLRSRVQFFTETVPDFSKSGTLADFFLRRQWIELRMAQNFEDLVCLPSLHGVDVYVHQQETVRRVLRHYKGRALLADEVGLGKTIEACLVLKEYWLRGLVRKALVLVPPSLARKYSLRIRIDPGDVLVVPLPVREISVRIIRKKNERIAKLHWNPALRALESPWCEACSGRAHPLWLCDGRVHFLCKSCLAACPACGKQFCRACSPKCRCGPAG